jgi:pyruvate,water dikinase
MSTEDSARQYIAWFENVGVTDVSRVGGKNASLGEMVRELAREGVRVPDGFATTAQAYWDYVEANGIAPRLRALFEAGPEARPVTAAAAEAARRLFLDGDFPPALGRQIAAAYEELSRRSGAAEVSVAVRSSATAEDLPQASFAGQQESFLNVRGVRDLLDACRRCYASLFTDRAIAYRQAQSFAHLDVALSIGVQRMVRSDLAGAGVMFSIDPETGFPRVAVINAAWGLGETVVQGTVDPDKYVVFKPLLADPGVCPILERTLGAKAGKTVYATGGSARTSSVATTNKEREAFVLSDQEIIQLARWAVAVEAHYGQPMDMEWAKDGETGELYMLQARPETVQAARGAASLKTYRLLGRGKVLLTGAAVGEAVTSAAACLIRHPEDMARFRDGAILVTEMTDPDWVPVMRRAAGIITDHGGTTSHAAIVSRELGVPAIVGTGHGTRSLRDGDLLTLSCAQGEQGVVYEGKIPFESEEVDLSALPATTTPMMVNMATPGAAFHWWRLPARGVGLARLEFIISNIIRVHPMALLQPERVCDPEAGRQIEALVRGYADGADYFVQTLARGIAKLAAPFHPHPVIVRLSDFKTNEYAGLLGGAAFEPDEENPMIGWRGASRYYDPRYRPGFALECRALLRVREQMGFRNVIVMVPFCRTVEEADRVLAVMAEEGLRRGEGGLQVYMMCEVPSNVILAEQFARRFDGFSIGSNDLTQLVLGVDRDSGDLARLFDERNEAVMRFIAEAIARAHASGIKIGICGQAPSNYPEFTRFLVERGIDSISLNPDSFVNASREVARTEAAMTRLSGAARPD